MATTQPYATLADTIRQLATDLSQNCDERIALAEILARLLRLDRLYERLIVINSELSAHRSLFKLDRETNTLRVMHGDLVCAEIELIRADPNEPIREVDSQYVLSYTAGEVLPTDTEAEVDLRLDLAEKLEVYYYSAHRLLKLAQKIPALKNLKCKQVQLVRNKLIEHADYGDPYTFGVTGSGPVIKPVSRGTRQWTDPGLIPNTVAFVAALSEAFGRLARENT